MSSGTPVVENPVREAQAQGAKVARSKTFDRLARSGFVARGVIYGIIGILALKLALGDGGRATNQQGALRTIAHQPFGRALVAAAAVGLAGYAIWRLIRAALGHGPEAGDSTTDRVAAVASGVAYVILCVTAVKILLGAPTAGAGHASKPAAGVLGWPGGPWIVGAAGAIVLGVGLYQGWKGLSQDFLDDSKTERMPTAGRHAFTVLGVVGHLARMIAFGLVGWFLIRAAIDYDPGKAVGLDGALARLGHAQYGPLALGVVAAGLIAFGLYSVVDARYRRL